MAAPIGLRIGLIHGCGPIGENGQVVMSPDDMNAVPSGFTLFNRKATEVLVLDSARYNDIIYHYEQEGTDIPLRSPINDDNVTYERVIRSQKSFHMVSVHDRRRPGTMPKVGNVRIMRGTIPHAQRWFLRNEHMSNLFLLIVQVVGVAQKDPTSSTYVNNEIHILVRDYFEHSPVMRVYMPHYLHGRLPQVHTGYMIQCLGIMKTALLFEAVRIAVIR